MKIKVLSNRPPKKYLRGRFMLAQILILLASLLAASPAQAVPNEFTIVGSGWGHGVGYSQYGALGQAREGKTFSQILNHYYPGVAISEVGNDQNIRVGLTQGRNAVFARAESAGSDNTSLEVLIDENPVANLSLNEILRIEHNGSQAVVSSGGEDGRANQLGAGGKVTLRPTGDGNIMNVVGSSPQNNPNSALKTAGHRYRYGFIDVIFRNGGLLVANDLKLHSEYLLGLGEMPSSWPQAALISQVITARSYAMGRKNGGIRANCNCHVYNNSTDQVFVGWSKESSSEGDNWRQAVNSSFASSGNPLALTFNGSVITAYYSSSTGGRTQPTNEVWGGVRAWSQSVDDAWSLDPGLNPNHRWVARVSQLGMANALGLVDVNRIDITERFSSGAVKTMVAFDSAGNSVTMSGRTFQVRLKLKSNYLVGAVDSQFADTLGDIPTTTGFDEEAYKAQQAAAEIASLTPQYQEASEQADEARGEANSARRKLGEIREQIELAQNDLMTLQLEIAQKEIEVLRAQSQIDDLVRILYMQGEMDMLSIMLSAQSPTDFAETLLALQLFASTQNTSIRTAQDLIKDLDQKKIEVLERQGELDGLLGKADGALKEARDALKEAVSAEEELEKLIAEKQKIVDAYNRSR
ncbi:MAG: SpoIID/LytB domain-containing protein [Candidatus Nanopelagicales bacterium]